MSSSSDTGLPSSSSAIVTPTGVRADRSVAALVNVIAIAFDNENVCVLSIVIRE